MDNNLKRDRQKQVIASLVEGTSIRRLTRLTNAFSKKLENYKAAIAMWFAYYYFVRPHMTLHTSPAVKAGIMKRRWKLNQMLDYPLAKSSRKRR